MSTVTVSTSASVSSFRRRPHANLFSHHSGFQGRQEKNSGERFRVNSSQTAQFATPAFHMPSSQGLMAGIRPLDESNFSDERRLHPALPHVM